MIGELAACPAMSISSYGGIQVHLSKCWGDGEYTRKKRDEGAEFVPVGACMKDADPAGIGLCPDCHADIVGGTL